MNNISLQLIDEQIAKLKACDLSKIEFDELKKLLKPILFNGFAMIFPSYHPPLPLFRGRVISSIRQEANTTSLSDNVPTTLKGLTCPPAETVKKFQRANSPGNPMFYCSKAPEVTIHELNLNVGDVAVISKWETINRLSVVRIGYEPEVFSNLKSDRICPNFDNKVPELAEAIQREINRRVQAFFSNEFMRKINIGNEHLYKLSAAIAELLRKELDASKFAELEKLHLELQGVEYPAVAAKGNSDNLALVPKFADQNLKLIRCELIIKINEIENIVADVSDKIVEDQIIWKGQQEKSQIFHSPR